MEPEPAPENWVVLKFGGTSVASADRWHTIAKVLRDRLNEGVRPFVVCSAVAGTSDHLESLLQGATEGRDPKPVLEMIRRAHRRLGHELDLDWEPLVAEPLAELEQLVRGAHLIRETPSRLRARVMSVGELMSTRLGAAWLSAQGLPATWRDAREMLTSEPASGSSASQRYLAATCDFSPDTDLQQTVAEDRIVVTQGFIARDPSGDTVLLGRGGSDTSAAYFAAKLAAKRLEIWTDVPGMFTANPRQVPTARLLRSLHYTEAEALAAMGGRVLHPRCIEPVRAHGIPLHVRCTPAPDMEGTVVSGEVAEDAGPKAISSRSGLFMVAMERPSRWQTVGFLNDVTACFVRRDLSIDLLSTSSSRIVATLDPSAAPLREQTLEALRTDLAEVCKPVIRDDMASVSIVGTGIRQTLHSLGPMLDPLRDCAPEMMAQAANDLNLTFVVPADEESALVTSLHQALFDDQPTDTAFGPRWCDLFPSEARPAPAQRPAAERTPA